MLSVGDLVYEEIMTKKVYIWATWFLYLVMAIIVFYQDT